MNCTYCGKNKEGKVSICSGCDQPICSLCSILEAPLNPYKKVDGKEVEICHIRKDGTYGVYK